MELMKTKAVICLLSSAVLEKHLQAGKYQEDLTATRQ